MAERLPRWHAANPTAPGSGSSTKATSAADAHASLHRPRLRMRQFYRSSTSGPMVRRIWIARIDSTPAAVVLRHRLLTVLNGQLVEEYNTASCPPTTSPTTFTARLAAAGSGWTGPSALSTGP